MPPATRFPLDSTLPFPPLYRVLVCSLLVLTSALVALATQAADVTKGPWIRGRVVDSENLPLAGVRVALEAIESPYREALRRLRREDPEVVAETRTRGDGRFELRTPTPGQWRVRLRKEGHGIRTLDLRALVADRELPPASLPGATVAEMSYAASLERHASEVGDTGAGPGPPVPHAVVALPADAFYPVSPRATQPEEWETGWSWSRLDEGGRARLAFESGVTEWSFELHLAGRAARRLAGGSTGAVPSIGLPIRTLDLRGEPMAGVVVGIRGTAFPQLSTDAAGEGLLRFPIEGSLWVELTGPGGEVGWAQLDPPKEGSKPERIDLVLGPPNMLEGRVIDRDLGIPVVGAWVFSRLERSGLVVRSDAEGRYRLPVREVRGELGVAAPGFLPFSRRFTTRSKLEDHGLANPLPDVPLRAAVLTFGHVADLDGAPVAGAEVRILPGDAASRGIKTKLLATLRTNDAGRFDPGPLAVGVYDLEARGEGYASLAARGIEVPRQDASHGPLDLGTLVLAPGLALEGRVVDSEGRPVPDAEVHYGTGGRLYPAAVKGAGKLAHTDPEGRFVLRDLGPGEQLALVVAKKGYLDLILARVEVAEREAFEVVLERAATVRGKVVDADGEPIAGAQIQLVPEGGGGMRMEGPSSEAVSDAEGLFALDGVAPGRVGLQAWAEGFQRWWRNGIEVPAVAGLEDIEIFLDEGFEVFGTVFDAEGRPLPRAPVIAHRPSSPRPMASAATDEEGHYRLRGLGQGPYSVMATFEHQKVRDTLEIGQGDGGGGHYGPREYRLDLRFAPSRSVSGRVISTNGEPIAGAMVIAGSPDGLAMLSSPRTTSDTEGRFRLEGVRPALYALEASHASFARSSLGQPLQVADIDIEGLELVMRSGATLHGRIAGLEPEALAEVDVSVEHDSVKPDYAGRFVFENLGLGSHLVTAEIPASGRSTQELLVVEEGMTTLEVELRFGEGLRLSAELTHQEQPLAGAMAAAQRLDAPGHAYARSDVDGSLVFEGLAPGQYLLQIKDLALGLEHRQEVRLDHDEHLEIELVTARVAGRVVTPDGQAVAEVPIQLQRIDDPAIVLRTGSDSQGVFAFGMVRPGRWRISALRPGVAAERELEVFEGGIDDLELILTLGR